MQYKLQKEVFIELILLSPSTILRKDLLTTLYRNGHSNQPFEVNNERE